MSVFLNGPASGVPLDLRRAPFFLRVVRDPDGKWDALDQLDDAPLGDEEVFVYRLSAPPQRAHVCFRDRGGADRSGWFEFGIYEYVPDAPTGDLRETAAWRSWATSQPKPWEDDA